MKNQPKPNNFPQFLGLLFSFSFSFYLVFPALAQDSSTAFWRRFFESSEPPTEPKGNDREAGTRGDDDICPIAPNNLGALKVWNIRPTLTWSGEITKLEIRELDSRTDLWNQRTSSRNKVESLSSNTLELYQVTVETDLQPGQIYEWYFSNNPSGEYDQYLPVEFTVMTAQERDSIVQELQQLEQELTAENITGDAAKLRRADFFASQNLWLEFWQEVLSMESPSEDLKALLASTIDQLCQ
ncbi:hypothetical protein ACL6C3_16440 [Capilliphycus salinus ALCB114379]|uniref:hypothetical protein n=1 Tax=Capilliphycus salinus TaxID=2768948 RepID=UPI0039A427F4